MSALSRTLTYGLLAAVTFVLLFPLLYAIAGSMMTPQELASYPPVLVPRQPRLQSFADLNSILQTGAITIGQVVTSALAAYAFVFLDLRWRGLWFALFLSTMMIPYESIIIPNYLFMADAGLINTYGALILPFLAAGFGTFLLRQFFLSFPRDLYEAALVDGCGHLRFLTTILVPLSRPALASLGIYAFLQAWNQYFWPLLVTKTEEMQTLQIGISHPTSSWPAPCWR